MNPATDAGKKQLSQNLMSQFTVFNLQEMSEFNDLKVLCESYIGNLYPNVTNVVELFLQLKKLTASQLKTTNNLTPTYSIRLLCRALKFAKYHSDSLSIKRGLYEGFHLYFTSSLDEPSTNTVIGLLREKFEIPPHFTVSKFIPNVNKLPFLHQTTTLLNMIDGIYFPAGPMYREMRNNLEESVLKNQNQFIITDTNSQYIKIILKALLANTSVLLEGVTSSGKSSLILFLAKIMGYQVTRINNHENVDLQDYLGSFQPDAETGQLKF